MSITTRTAEISLDETGILRVKVLEGVKIDLDDALDNFLVTKQLSAGQRRLKLIDTRVNWKIAKEARHYFLIENTPEKTIARAILVKSLFDKFTADFVNMLYRPQIPQKIFLSEKEALKWLNTFR